MSLLLTLGDTTPNIRTLFANGEQGLALDVEAAYLRGWVFQDSAGATVAAAAGDPVGLILDTAKGGLDNLGPELVTNGQFGTDTTGWSNSGGTFTAANGVATKDHSVTGYATFPFTTVVGRFYQMSGTLKSGSTSASSFMAIRKADNTNATTNAVNCVSSGTSPLASDASQTIIFQATATTTYAIVQGNGVHSVIVDNISVREIPGNHAYQTTSGSRPLLARTPDGGRRNLLTYSETLSNAVWVNAATSGGTRTNGALSLSSNEGYVYFRQDGNFNSSVDHVLSFDVTCDQTIANVPIRAAGTASVSQLVNLTAGVTTRVTLTGYKPNGGTASIEIGLDARNAIVPGGSDSTGYTVTFNRVQLEIGSSATAYQKVGLTSDVTESGKRDCWGLLFDGSDDFLQTASIDFSATDKMTVMAGVRKLSASDYQLLMEMSANVGANNGAIGIFAPYELQKYWVSSRGSANAVASSDPYTAPVTHVLSVAANISADSLAVRVNGASAATSSSDQGSGNYGSHILYIGRRAGTSLPYNGLLYTLIIRGATTPTGTIADFEKNLLRIRAGLGPF